MIKHTASNMFNTSRLRSRVRFKPLFCAPASPLVCRVYTLGLFNSEVTSLVPEAHASSAF
ncbi:hypothetical protein HanXRQr2_Chr06g0246071 [Helianthus annuus]|uniref:Uncharacterized protein n=1 Tax=Helianthus annuus TaxID=4232 RepID=A0A9K3NIA0_HELAN|nr:hypothetical protein HanXRQr2_Chr06g0246071 [Helianthus annuus]